MKLIRSNPWLLLLALQAVAVLVLFFDFLTGRAYFAYTDIGSDTFTAFTPIAQHIARSVAQEGFTGWSFGIGLGSATALWLGDVFMWLNAIGGPDNVLPLRIWVYVLKLVLGGMAMLALLRLWFQSGAVQVTGALAYTFCGYVVVNGQWDSEAAVFIMLPLILWAIVRQLRGGGWLALPLVVALSLVCGSFFVSLGVFLALTGVAFVALSDNRGAMLKAWLTRIVPLMALGFLLAAPALVPMMLQFLDGSRVSGGQNLFDKLLSQGFSVTDLSLIQVQLGSLLHKDIFGVGSAYRGYWNYLEGPGFYIGVMPLLLIAQLARGNTQERRALYWGLAALVAYIVLPVFRLAAMGFAAPYFRVSTLWVTMMLLLLAVLALQRVLRDGVDARMLWAGMACFGVLLIVANLGDLGQRVWTAHVVKLIGLAVATAVVLVLAQHRILPVAALSPALMALVLLDALLVARSSYLEGRSIVTPQTNAYQDGTAQALQTIRKSDPGVYRIEKSYRSASLADALAQDYRGVASYSFHSKAAADFEVATGLIPPPEQAPAVNYTNWLPDPGPRFMLQSLLGVKYLISRIPLTWPGFTPVSNGHGLMIYRNDYALPLGVVQTSQVTASDFAKLASLPEREAQIFRDITVMNAVVVTELDPAHGLAFDLDSLVGSNALTLEKNYFAPAQVLQGTGLRIQTFASNHIVGTINPTRPGILVFSIPFNQGWSLNVDGVARPMMRANFGMLAAPVAAGRHTVELEFRLPGQRVGAVLGVLGLGLLVWLGFTRGRSRKCEQKSAIQVLH